MIPVQYSLRRRTMIPSVGGGKLPRPDGTVLLMHFDNSLNDETGSNNPSYAPSGNAQYADSLNNYSAAISLSGSNYVRIPYQSNRYINYNADFTLAFWVYCGGPNQYFFYTVSNRSETDYGMYMLANPNGSLNWTAPSAWAYAVTGANVFTFNEWHHIAITRHSGAVSLFVDGTSVATKTHLGSVEIGSSAELFIGSAGTSGKLNGKIDEFIIVNGTAVWTENFTPPSYPFE